MAHAQLATIKQMQADEIKHQKADSDLVYKAFFGNSDEVQALIAAGANPNALNENGVPALALAAQRKTPAGLEVVKALLANGADMNTLDRNGQTPLFYAARVGNMPSVLLLLNVGADFYLADNTGNIARNVAYLEGHDEVYKAMDAFVNEKREAVLKEYAEQNEKNKQQIEVLKAKKELAKAAMAQTSPPTKEITLPLTEEKRSEFMHHVSDLAFSSCAYQYWFLASSYNLKTDLSTEEVSATVEKYKKIADNASKTLVDDFHESAQFVNQISKPSQKEIADALGSMGSNITRKSNGVGSLADMKKRCSEIGARVMVLAAPEPTKITKIVPLETEEDTPSVAPGAPESSVDPATALPSAPADEAGTKGDKLPPQESL